MRAVRASALAALMLLAAAPSRVAAQEGEPPEAYREAILAAVEEFQAQRWSEARALFRQAHEISPNARTWRGIGLTSFEMREYPEALRALARALDDLRRPLGAEHRAHAQQLIAQCHAFTGRYRPEVQPIDAAATLRVDGAEVELVGGWVVVGLGVHTVSVEADGYAPFERAIRVRGGEQDPLVITLERLSEPTAQSDPIVTTSRVTTPTTTPAEDVSDAQSLATLSLVSGGVLALGAGGVGVYWVERDSSAQGCAGCAARGAILEERDWARGLTLGFAGASAAALGLGLLWLDYDLDPLARAIPAFVLAAVELVGAGIGLGLSVDRGAQLARCGPETALCLNEATLREEQAGAHAVLAAGLGAGLGALGMAIAALAIDDRVPGPASSAVRCAPGLGGMRCVF